MLPASWPFFYSLFCLHENSRYRSHVFDKTVIINKEISVMLIDFLLFFVYNIGHFCKSFITQFSNMYSVFAFVHKPAIDCSVFITCDKRASVIPSEF